MSDLIESGESSTTKIKKNASGYLCVAVCISALAYGFATSLPISSLLTWLVANSVVIGGAFTVGIGFLVLCYYASQRGILGYVLSGAIALIAWGSFTYIIFPELCRYAPPTSVAVLIFACTAIPICLLGKATDGKIFKDQAQSLGFSLVFAFCYFLLLNFVGLVLQLSNGSITHNVSVSADSTAIRLPATASVGFVAGQSYTCFLDDGVVNCKASAK